MSISWFIFAEMKKGMQDNLDNVKVRLLKTVIDHNDMVRIEGFVNAGFPSPANDYIEKELHFRELFIRNESSTFFVEVAGNSMINAGIHDSDILVVDKSLDLRDDSIVVCFVDGEFTVKRVSKTDGIYYLIPENSNFKPIRIDEGSDFRLWGIVTFVIHKFR